jgi:hypothetical protein
MNNNQTDSEYINALQEIYNEACSKKNYKLCDILRLEIQKYLTGKHFLIRIESDLKLNNNIF